MRCIHGLEGLHCPPTRIGRDCPKVANVPRSDTCRLSTDDKSEGGYNMFTDQALFCRDIPWLWRAQSRLTLWAIFRRCPANEFGVLARHNQLEKCPFKSE